MTASPVPWRRRSLRSVRLRLRFRSCPFLSCRRPSAIPCVRSCPASPVLAQHPGPVPQHPFRTGETEREGRPSFRTDPRSVDDWTVRTLPARYPEGIPHFKRKLSTFSASQQQLWISLNSKHARTGDPAGWTDDQVGQNPRRPSGSSPPYSRQDGWRLAYSQRWCLLRRLFRHCRGRPTCHSGPGHNMSFHA